MAPHRDEEYDRAMLRACKDLNPHALEELGDRYYTDIFLHLSQVLAQYGYTTDVLHDMTLDCLGKLAEAGDSAIRWNDLDTAVARVAASYARVELRNVMRRS